MPDGHGSRQIQAGGDVNITYAGTPPGELEQLKETVGSLCGWMLDIDERLTALEETASGASNRPPSSP